MTTQVYEVPIIFHGLRQAEAYLQVSDSLDNLNHVVDEVFSKITDRVFKERSRLESLSNRLGVAQAKVQQIVGTTKAITVFSSAKYPAPQASDYVPLYAENRAQPPKFNNYKLQDVPLNSLGSEEPLDASELLLMETGTISSRLNEIGTVQEGLGRLPSRIPSVSALLLFNSRENPYKKYGALDNLAGAGGAEEKKAHHAAKQSALSAAPESVLKGDSLNMPGVQEYGYRPVLGDVPEFNLPSVLPNLSNVADINWSVSLPDANASGIAPSQNLPVFTFDLPNPTPNGTTTAPAAPAPSGGGAPPPPPPPPSSGGPPPPPPPPPPSSGGPPPPPPPPPPPGPPPPPPAGKAKDMEELPATSDARNDLLEAIRRGKTLKKANTEQKKPPPPKKKASEPSGDLFGDLITALNRRRQGIAANKKPSGNKKKEDDDIKGPPPEAEADEESDNEEWEA